MVVIKVVSPNSLTKEFQEGGIIGLEHHNLLIVIKDLKSSIFGLFLMDSLFSCVLLSFVRNQTNILV